MKGILLALTFFIFSATTIAQSNKQKADSLYGLNDYQQALRLYSKYIRNNENDSLTLYKMGNAHEKLQQYEEAIKYLKRAVSKNFYPGFTYAQIAKNQASLNDLTGFDQTLDSLTKYNPGAFATIEKNPIYKTFLLSETTQNKLKQMKVKSYPCLGNEKNRLFDFWIGQWEVFANGGKAGENTITLANGGCAIHESYTTNGAYTGQSINFVDTNDGLWKQYWVGSSGDVLNFQEVDSEKGKLVFLAKSKNNGQENWTRMTFTFDPVKEEVNQYIESSSDEGKSWSVSFNGQYKKRKS